MLFRLANALATFQSYIYRALSSLINYTCVVYLDNILIYSKKKEDYINYIKEVLNQLIEQGLFYKASKCVFLTKSVKFLGFIVTLGGVVIDLIRVQIIQEQLEPKVYKDIQVFLSFINFYCCFIFNYSSIVRPLVDYITATQLLALDLEGSDLTKGGKKLAKSCKGLTKQYKLQSQPNKVYQAFLTIRQKFTKALVL